MKHFLKLTSHIMALLILSVFTYRLWRNLRFLHCTGESIRPAPVPPRVSILVPARNEVRTIASCIESLASQDYPDFEIIALDDQSSDTTGAILDHLAAYHAKLTVVHGVENPPKGWN